MKPNVRTVWAAAFVMRAMSGETWRALTGKFNIDLSYDGRFVMGTRIRYENDHLRRRFRASGEPL